MSPNSCYWHSAGYHWALGSGQLTVCSQVDLNVYLHFTLHQGKCKQVLWGMCQTLITLNGKMAAFCMGHSLKVHCSADDWVSELVGYSLPNMHRLGASKYATLQAHSEQEEHFMPSMAAFSEAVLTSSWRHSGSMSCGMTSSEGGVTWGSPTFSVLCTTFLG